ncbi:MAG: PTS sugar transporter subunit IIA [Deltaproteobacteria bacterium]|nr:PTS sugar transporter subunit IIA [Deltaproteobacteria bacterium]
MIGLVVFTHGSLASSLLDTVAEVGGPLDAAVALEVSSGDDPATLAGKLARAMDIVDSGDGVLVFVDLLGGTPWNTSISFMNSRNMDVLAGLNLPILIKCVLERKAKDPHKLARLLLEYGRDHLVQASELLYPAENDG